MALPARRAVYQFGNFSLHLDNEALRTNQGVSIPLRPKSFALLRLMVENAGRLLTRETIMETLWPNIYVTDDNITQCVQDIRRALGHDGPHLLRTIRGRGYIFEAGGVRQETGLFRQDGFQAFQPNHTVCSHTDTLSVGYKGACTPACASGPRSRTEKSVRLSVLVVPLKNLVASSAHERLAESVTEDIVTDLTRCLKYLAPGEARVLFQDDRLAHLRTVPMSCPADYVLRGSVQGLPKVSVSLQLIEASTEVCIWAERCELAGQSNMVARLVSDISAVLVRDVGRRIESLSTPELTPHDLHLQGRAWLLRPASFANNRQALCCFERAIAMEPDTIGPRLGIAMVLVRNLSNGWSDTIEQDQARAEALLLDLIQTGTDSPVIHTINGTLQRLQGHLDASRVELEMALALAPCHAMAASQLGLTLSFLGRPEAALPHLERSVRVGRHDPQAPLLWSNLGMGRLLLGDAEGATDNLRKAEAGNPYSSGTLLLLAAALGRGSASAEASAKLRRATGLCPSFGTLSNLRKWVEKQASTDFLPIYEDMIERGLQGAGMPEE